MLLIIQKDSSSGYDSSSFWIKYLALVSHAILLVSAVSTSNAGYEVARARVYPN